jgi:hypothetical protein
MRSRFTYRGSLAATKRDLIQPVNWSLSTCTQSPSRFLTVKRVPLRADPTTRVFAEGPDLICTPGRCTKTMSWFCDAEAVSRAAAFSSDAASPFAEVSTVETGRSGHLAAKDGSGEDWGATETV